MRRAPRREKSFRHAFPDVGDEKGKEEGGSAPLPRVRGFDFERVHHATPLLLLTMTTTFTSGQAGHPLRRELVLLFFVRDPKYVAHEPGPRIVIWVRTPRGSAFARSARCSRASVASGRMTRPDPRVAASRARAVVFAFRGQRLERLFDEAKAKGHLRLAREPKPRFAESGCPVDRVNRRAKLTTERSPRRVAA